MLLLRIEKSYLQGIRYRTLVLVLLSAGTIFLFLKKKLSQNLVVIVFAVLIVFDLVSTNRQYVNADNFEPALRVDRPYKANAADKEILKDKGHFRVFDMSNEGQRAPGRAAYFHNSLLGYHAAKLGRMDELLDFHVYKNNMNVINMLNTKYIIAQDEQGNIFPYTNTDANGNAWFVSEIKQLDSANDEITILDSLDTKNIAVTTMGAITSGIKEKIFAVDSAASIELTDFKPNYLKYQSTNTNRGFAVFSEVYYSRGWNAYIDGKLEPHYRVNYVLRGLEIPKGKHTIEFKFEPEVVTIGSKIALASSVLFGILFVIGIAYQFKKENYQA